MSEAPTGEALFDGPWVVDGNTAKVKVLLKLRGLMAGERPLAVLDVGCVGLQPLRFWEPLLGRYPFHLTGIDVAGMERAEAVAREKGWGPHLTLREGSGYNLTGLFPPGAFDVVVATQVLEHTARLGRLMAQVAAVLRSGGDAFFTADSAHYRARYRLREPIRLAKNVVKQGLSMLGRERHYDLPWTVEKVTSACMRAGLEVLASRYYNLVPLKVLHNQILPENAKNVFMRRWFELEEQLNEMEDVRTRARHLFAGLYVHARRGPDGGRHHHNR